MSAWWKHGLAHASSLPLSCLVNRTMPWFFQVSAGSDVQILLCGLGVHLCSLGFFSAVGGMVSLSHWSLGLTEGRALPQSDQRTRDELQPFLESTDHTYLVFCPLGGSLTALNIVNGTGSSKLRWVLWWAKAEPCAKEEGGDGPFPPLCWHCWHAGALSLLGGHPHLCGASWGVGIYFPSAQYRFSWTGLWLGKLGPFFCYCML